MFDYFYGAQAEQFAFYRVPKVLFTNDRFKYLSAEAKTLYGILLDRVPLSAKNGWIDEQGRVYIICTIEEIIRKLFALDEAEFAYFDMNRNAYRRIRAICSRKYNGTGKCYVMLYNLDVQKAEPSEPLVRIRTFGYFDVFVGEQPIAFRNDKSKELFALLVDRRGGFVSSEEAIGFLWENEPASSLTMARYRKVALRLKNILEEYGVADMVESVNGKRRLIPEMVKCDLYDYLTGKQEYAQLFKGSYLTNYSWGESTLAELTGDYLYAAEQ